MDLLLQTHYQLDDPRLIQLLVTALGRLIGSWAELTVPWEDIDTTWNNLG